jgi:toxin CcdB
VAQFDVHKNPGGGLYPLLLDVQSSALDRLDGRVVVPLVPRKKYGAKPIARLNPTAVIGNVEYVLVFQDLAQTPLAALGERVVSLSARRSELIAALDFLFTGI